MRGRAQADSFGTEGPAQVGQAPPESGEGLAPGAVGPERSCEPGPLDCAAVAEGKESEEPALLVGAEAWQGAPLHANLERAEEADRQGRHGSSLPASGCNRQQDSPLRHDSPG